MKRWLVILSVVVAVLVLLTGTSVALLWQRTSDDTRSEVGSRGPVLDGDGGVSMGGAMRGTVVRSESEYLQDMIAHHREAVVAASSLRHSHRTQMRRLGAEIVRTQTAQITLMSGWLKRWYPTATSARYQPVMRDLSALSGGRLDRAFLEDMVFHHMEAVMMSRRFLVQGLARHAAVRRLAQRIIDDQSAEIVQMQQWLVVWFPDSRLSWRGMGML